MTQISHPSQKIPKLRFREFQDEYENVKLGDLSSKIGDGLHSTPIYDEIGEYYFVNGNNISNGKIVVNSDTKKVDRSEFDKHKKELSNRSLLLSINGTIGNLAFYNGERIILGKSACYINLLENTSIDYIYTLLQTNGIMSYFNTAVTGSTIKNLGIISIKNTPINIPTLPEQQKIASFLLSVDTSIEQLREKKSLLEEYKKGVMRKIFAREIRFKNENGEEYGEWEEKRLGDYCDLKNGYAFKSNTYEEDGKYRIITIANVQDGYLELGSGNTIIELPKDIKEHQKLQLGDLLISMTGNVGRVCIVTEENLLLNQRVGKLVFRDCEKNYIFQLLRTKTFLDGMIMCAQGGAQPNLSKDDILGFPIIIPSDIKEQQKIASFLSEIDSKIQSITEQLEEALKWKKGLLQGMFV